MPSLPPSRYNLSTYWGRVRHAADLTDPSTLFISADQLSRCRELIARYQDGRLPPLMTPDLWRAKKVLDATLHPDTQQPVPLPFRMSAFVPVNLIVTAGMLTPNMRLPATLAWQVANQSLNVAINRANANHAAPLSTPMLLRSYLLAVSASCSVAWGLRALVPRLRRLSPQARLQATRLVPFAAVAAAGVANVVLMRSPELSTGIPIFPASSPAPSDLPTSPPESSSLSVPNSSSDSRSPPPDSLGNSRAAARLAIAETAASRVLNATPVMVIPPLLLVRLQRTAWLQRHPRATLPVNLALILCTSVFALPMALAAFPQRQQINPRKLEKEFWGREELVEFNRGL